VAAHPFGHAPDRGEQHDPPGAGKRQRPVGQRRKPTIDGEDRRQPGRRERNQPAIGGAVDQQRVRDPIQAADVLGEGEQPAGGEGAAPGPAGVEPPHQAGVAEQADDQVERRIGRRRGQAKARHQRRTAPAGTAGQADGKGL
jgi:hypothetical protein